MNVDAAARAVAGNRDFDALTLNGTLGQTDFRSNRFTHGLTVNGTWNLKSTGTATAMTFNGTQAIEGVGEIVLTDNVNNRIFGDGANVLSVDTDIVIRGSGGVGANATLDNTGAIVAEWASTTLNLQGNGVTNQGTLRAKGIAGLEISSGEFSTSGNVLVDAGSRLVRTGD
jgi:hypothetical protein